MVDNQGAGGWMEDNLLQGSLGVAEVDNHRVVHRTVRMFEVDIQLREEFADQCVTSAEQGALPLLVVAQTCRLFCPSRSCVVSEKFIQIAYFDLMSFKKPVFCEVFVDQQHTCIQAQTLARGKRDETAESERKL